MAAHELQRILYVEDEPDIQAVAKIALEDVGGPAVVEPSVALTGDLGLSRDALESLGRVSLAGGPPTRNGRPVRWGEDLVAGDLLEDRGQFIVMLADDGDGVLGPGDRVTQCWRRPAVVTSLGQAILDDAAGAELLRHVR